ncbi:hypothetical protein Cni_G02122 [Canna indica]|uniref:Ubiquitin thioesterase OTU1 n=1 Tax=Canna indica TaxID=4628 RepID=A0AAQ3JRX6_9LILI|nr:hypothetical protein Cni_G02122 [Canna indica]
MRRPPNLHSFVFLFTAYAVFSRPAYGRSLHARFLLSGFPPSTPLLPLPSSTYIPSPAPSTLLGACLIEYGIVVRRVITSDNSCLFNAVGYVMEHDQNKAHF